MSELVLAVRQQRQQRQQLAAEQRHRLPSCSSQSGYRPVKFLGFLLLLVTALVVGPIDEISPKKLFVLGSSESPNGLWFRYIIFHTYLYILLLL